MSDTSSKIDAIVLEKSNFGSIQRLRLTANGRLEYSDEDATHGRTVTGQVLPTAALRMIAALEGSTFPQPLCETVVPGSVQSVVAEPSGRYVFFNSGDADHLPGYKDIVPALDELMAAVANNESSVLGQWQFEQEAATPWMQRDHVGK